MSKSRSGKTPSTNQSAPPGPTQNAIIPGKFMESDWYELLEIEEDENFIADIIDEITDAALDQVASNIVKSRVLPHTVLSARELLLEIIDWVFLQSDPGEVGTNEKLSWVEDDEPLTSVIDNWAQGAVPVERSVTRGMTTSVSSPLPSVVEDGDFAASIRSGASSADGSTEPELLEMDISNDNVDGDVRTDEVDVGLEDSVLSVTVQMKESLNISQNSNDSLQKKLPCKPRHSSTSSLSKKKSKKFRPHVGPIPVFEKISLESVTDLRPKPGTRVAERSSGGLWSGMADMEPSAELLVRNQYGRASGPKEVVYDENGKVVKVEKLNVAHFPTHRVPVKYCIVDDETSPSSSTTRRNHKKKQESGGRRNAENDRRLEKGRINATALLQRINAPINSWTSVTSSDLNYGTSMRPLGPRSPLPPLMVDSMNVSDGVTIREGGLSKQVIKKSTLESITNNHNVINNNSTMLPISEKSTRVLNVKDIVSDSSPRYITNTA